MAYICNKPPNSCKNCDHYRYDDDRMRMACFAQIDNSKKNKKELEANKSIWLRK